MPIDFFTDQQFDGTNPIEYFVQFDTGETFPLVLTATQYLYRLEDADISGLAVGEHTACVLRENNTEPDSIVGVVPSFVWNGYTEGSTNDGITALLLEMEGDGFRSEFSLTQLGAALGITPVVGPAPPEVEPTDYPLSTIRSLSTTQIQITYTAIDPPGGSDIDYADSGIRKWLVSEFDEKYCRATVTFRNSTGATASFMDGATLKYSGGKYYPVRYGE